MTDDLIDLDEYATIEEYSSAYKFHKTPVHVYAVANIKCKTERAELFYPTDGNEGKAVFSLIGDKTVDHIQVGIQKLPDKHYTTLSGGKYICIRLSPV
jgi:hypothetical protein